MVRSLSMGGLLNFNISSGPVFLNDLQFMIFTLIFFQKVAGKTHNFRIFSKGRHFMLGEFRNVNLGVFWKTSVGSLKRVFSLIFSRYYKNYIILNDKKAQI